jgi:hypothetical protein
MQARHRHDTDRGERKAAVHETAPYSAVACVPHTYRKTQLLMQEAYLLRSTCTQVYKTTQPVSCSKTPQQHIVNVARRHL